MRFRSHHCIFCPYLLGLALCTLAFLGCSGSIDGTENGGAHTGPSDGGTKSEAGNDASGRVRAGWKLFWHDEFNEATCPDTTKWGFERGFVRNYELQWYEPDNASCQDGVLVIEARREYKPNPNYSAGNTDWRRSGQSAAYTSTSMFSKHSFTYGRFEMRARIDTDEGGWPAFWTAGTSSPPSRRPCWARTCGVGWPQSGEVDIMEYYEKAVQANVCKPMGSTCGWSSIGQSLASLGSNAWTNAFHVWAMYWDAQNIDLFLDGKLVNHFAVADAVGPGQQNPYVNKPQHLLLSLAIGGTNGGDPTNTAFPLRFEVDYVRVYHHRER